MRRFEFGLEKVRRLRCASERQVLADLARALGAVREAEEKLRQVADRRDHVLSVIGRRLRQGRMDVAWIELHHRDLERFEREESRGRRALDASRAKYDAALEALRERQSERKALDTLHDKERERHEEETRREEGIVQDEIALSRHNRIVS